MVSTLTIFRDISRAGIALEWGSFAGAYWGLYIWHPALVRPVIVLEDELHTQETKLREVCAHELGHHYKYVNLFPATAVSRHYIYEIEYGRSEGLATRWAVDYLVPERELLPLLHKQYSLEELMDHFMVGPEFILKRMEHLAYEKIGAGGCNCNERQYPEAG